TFNTRLMEAGVLQEIRMTLMGHSQGSRVHAIYTHIELPAKREAIRKLEQWVEDQQKQLKAEKEKSNASSQTERSESTPGEPAASGQAGPQTVEEEIAGRGGSRTSRKAQVRDRRDGRGAQRQASPASEVRRGPQAV